MVKKVFNCLIEEVQVFTGENPVKKGLKLPKKGGMVLDRLPGNEESLALLSVEVDSHQTSSSFAPTREIVIFLLYTGARLSEALQRRCSKPRCKDSLLRLWLRSDPLLLICNQGIWGGGKILPTL
ncbi:MAG: hypothetical protein A2600_12985 [Candidatus Lambdaproteobacteria bacterium RIFOXYD1_FULL_56_27]|nr:MAG: hypothetical protein A2600_12985 [Candidatus Lambdaproteobacteria bacterium RIFOXYD1_FULL_56_27]